MAKSIERNLEAEEKAKKRLLAFLDKVFKCKGEWRAYIETWSDGPWGLRLAEIGVQKKSRMAGGTYFRSEAGNALMFLRCEDLLAQWAYKVGPADDAIWFKKQIREHVKAGIVVLLKTGRGKKANWQPFVRVYESVDAARAAIEVHEKSSPKEFREYRICSVTEVS